MYKSPVDMSGKKGVIMGVANDKSIAWGIAKIMKNHGAEMIFTYQGDVLQKRVAPLADELGAEMLQCDVSTVEGVVRAFEGIKEHFGEIDFVVHAIGYSDKSELKGKYADTSLDNFLTTMNISCYSFTSVVREAAKLMKNGGSMLTLSYDGSNRVMPNYNVMGVAKAALEASVRYLAEDYGKHGIRVNSISAGPIRTLAASGIGDFRYILNWNEKNSPLRRNITTDDVGRAALFLLSELGSGVTGENLLVDGGYNIMGMQCVDVIMDELGREKE